MNLELILTAGDAPSDTLIGLGQQCRREYNRLSGVLDSNPDAFEQFVALTNAYEILMETFRQKNLTVVPIDHDLPAPTPAVVEPEDPEDPERLEEVTKMTPEEISENLDFLIDSPAETPGQLAPIPFSEIGTRIRASQIPEEEMRSLLSQVETELRQNPEMTGMAIVRREILRDILVSVLPEPAAEPTAEPAAEPTAEPAAEPTAKPVAEPTAKPAAPETTAESTAEPAAPETTET